MAKRPKFCNDDHRVRFRNGQKLDGGTLVPVDAMAAASFCPWCGAYVPNANERAVGIRGKRVTFTPCPADFPNVTLDAQVLRILVNPAGMVCGDLDIGGAVFPSEALAGRVRDAGSVARLALAGSIG